VKLDRDVVVTPARVRELLGPRGEGVEIATVDVVGESEGSASRLRLALTFRDGNDGGLPASMFLKRNLAEFTFPPEMYLTECRFYRDLAPHLDLETPAVYGLEIDETTGAFVLLMEDLGARARLGIATDPVTPDEVASVLDDLAVLHAPYWASERVRRDLPWLQRPDESTFVRFWQEAGPKLARKNLAGHRAAVVADAPWVHDRLWPAFDRLVEELAGAPRTVLHGDVHIGNTYFVPGQRGGVLDWQLMLHGSWVVDVGYLLTSAFEPEVRARHERDLLREYLAALRAQGVDAPGDDDAWQQYRRSAVWGVVMWVVTPDGVHTDAVQVTSLRRAVAAAEDLESLALLEDEGSRHG
jgi:aminoglycoside phosphotransferase (APT) family kinase protein